MYRYLGKPGRSPCLIPLILFVEGKPVKDLNDGATIQPRDTPQWKGLLP